MSGVKAAHFQATCQWQASLQDYVTAIAWTPDGHSWAAASAQGDVVLYHLDGRVIPLAPPTGAAINSLGFSAEGRFLAAGGQAKVLTVWSIPEAEIVWQQPYPGAWIDTLAWHPTVPLLAVGVGTTVRLLEMSDAATVAQLDFHASSVLHLAWHPTGDRLAVSGHGGVKVWTAQDWTAPPRLIAVPGASLHCAWSPEGRYLASGNLDRTLTVTEWDAPPPWLMQGFPGKVRQVAWAPPQAGSAPQLAAACAEGITVWQRYRASRDDWRSRVLQYHRRRVNAIAFHPQEALLASAGEAGQLVLWHQGRQRIQTLTGFTAGVAEIAWSPRGDRLLAAGTAGDLHLWQVSRRAQGFGW